MFIINVNFYNKRFDLHQVSLPIHILCLLFQLVIPIPSVYELRIAIPYKILCVL